MLCSQLNYIERIKNFEKGNSHLPKTFPVFFLVLFLMRGRCYITLYQNIYSLCKIISRVQIKKRLRDIIFQSLRLEKYSKKL